jgi:hypothetical protein
MAAVQDAQHCNENYALARGLIGAHSYVRGPLRTAALPSAFVTRLCDETSHCLLASVW